MTVVFYCLAVLSIAIAGFGITW